MFAWRVAIGGISLAAVAMLSAPISAKSAQFVWNLTPSAPAGLYRIERSVWNAGDRVAVLPSPALAADLNQRGVLQNGKLLIKRVAAAAGDTVCRQRDEVSVNGRIVAIARLSGSDGALLPIWRGCAKLNDMQVFLLGDTADSYDGRYFGVTSANDVIGRAVFLAASQLWSLDQCLAVARCRILARSSRSGAPMSLSALALLRHSQCA